MENHILNKMTSWIPWTRSEKRASEEEETETGPNLLLSLLHPDVTNIVLDNLDPKSLLALRLVCRKTKQWIDHPKYLCKLRITLHPSAGSKKMRKVIRSKTAFCNFRIGCEKQSNEDLILEFGQRFGPNLKVLDINTMTSHTATINLLSHCPSLEVLTLLGINLSKLAPNDIQDINKISKVLANLRSLSIGNVLFVEETEMKYFRSILRHCTKLISLRLPYVNFHSKRPSDVRDGILAKYVLDPVVQSIRQRGESYTTQPNMKYLILEYLNPLPSKLFIKVAEVCFEYKTILHNVHESHLKKCGSSLQPLLQIGVNVQEVIGTLDGLNGNIYLGRLINLKSISIRVSSALLLKDDNLKDPRLPNLLNINFYVDTVSNDARLHKLIESILGEKRPSVTNLKISYSSRREPASAELIRAVDIAHNFQYLRKLDIYQWDADDKEFLTLWRGLGSHRIQDLSLLLCTNLSDRGLLGDDPKKPAILALTGLKELHISSLYGSITDITLHRALRHMQLQKLRIYSQSITYDGIASLLEGVLHLTIDYIHFSKPLDCSQKEFYYLAKDIINAKNVPDFHKRKHLRRRSQPLVLFQVEMDDID